ncbi:MAG: DUF1573 domain-containing protein [Bacteroidota bacterium]
MLKYNIFYLLMMVLVLSCTGGSQSEEKQQSNSKPEITFNEDKYDLGSVNIGDTVTHQFIFTNTGNDDLVINEVEARCGCTTVPYYSSRVIPPGDTGSIKIELQTAGLFGHQAKAILVQSNDGESSKRLIIRAFVE